MNRAGFDRSLLGMDVLVIGGTSGIGEQVARQAASAGAQVTVTGRDPHRRGAAAGQEWVSRAAVLDAHDDDRIETFFADLHPVDHVVSLVGDSMAGGFLTTPPEIMRNVLDSKFWANWQIARHASSRIRSGGSLTFTSGTGGRAHQISATFIANQAVAALVAGVAYELAPNVRVNAVAPTFLGTATRFWRDIPESELIRQQDDFAKTVPMGRTAVPEEVASTYLHLMTNAYITGQVIAVDGGVMLDK